MNDRFKFRIAVYERQQNNMPWAFVEYIDPDNQHWGLNQCGDIISDSSYSAHYTRKNAPDSVHRVYEPEMSTGLKDKNGNLIYEGDIIKDEFYRRFTIVWSEEDCAFEGRVIYRDPEYSDRFDLYKGATDNCEIIGNIHKQAEQKDK
jgi:uncharacterized phage protein (TIGR01671 family)